MRVMIVLPHWFDDCLRIGKKISERPYMLPNPEVLNTATRQPARIGAAVDVQGASTARPQRDDISPPATPSKHRKDINVFQGKALLLASDLALSTHLVLTLTSLITDAGGCVVGTQQGRSSSIRHALIVSPPQPPLSTSTLAATINLNTTTDLRTTHFDSSTCTLRLKVSSFSPV